MALYEFEFKGYNSDYMGVCVTSLPPHVIPARRYTEHTIPGRDGVVRTWDGAYEAILLPVGLYIPARTAAEVGRLAEICDWLDGRGWLTLSDRPFAKYDVTVTLETQLDQWVNGFSDLVGTVTFKAEPYAYRLYNPTMTITASGGRYNNTGKLESEPVIRIFGSGRFNMVIGGQALEFSDVPAAASGKPAIIVDSTLGDCYSAAGANLNHCMTGEFPALAPGQGAVTWTICRRCGWTARTSRSGCIRSSRSCAWRTRTRR